MSEAAAERDATSIILVSDFVWPWCYIGLVEVGRLAQEYEFDLRLAPFLLRPETPPEGMPARRSVSPEAPPTPIEQRGETLGLRFSRGRTITSNSHLALEAAEFGRGSEHEVRFHLRVFKAYFEDLEDIGSVETMVRCAVEAGLDGEALRAALTDRRHRDRVDEGIAWSRGIGVTAIPTFVINQRYGIVGAQELDTFRQMMAQVGQAPKPS